MIYCNSKLGNIVIKALILTWISFISISPTLFCQDLTTIKSASPVKVTGSFYSAFNYTFSDASIPPAGFNTGINVNFNFYNAINIPLSFAYSNYGSSVNTISFNRFGISPSYKSLKIHAGHRSYVLSPYLMSGLTVLGGGIELNPKKFYFLAFYGKVNDPYFVGNDVLTLRNDGFDFFNRKGYGFKLGFGKSTNRIGIGLFHAKDDLLTGSIDTLAKYNLNGKENVGIGLDLTQQFFKLADTAEIRTQGTIVSVTDGIVRIHGLSDVMQGEMLEFPGNTYGLALNLERDSVGAVIMGAYEHIREGDVVKCTGPILEVPVGEGLLGVL